MEARMDDGKKDFNQVVIGTVAVIVVIVSSVMYRDSVSLGKQASLDNGAPPMTILIPASSISNAPAEPRR
jgi:hypothetical protein